MAAAPPPFQEASQKFQVAAGVAVGQRVWGTVGVATSPGLRAASVFEPWLHSGNNDIH